MTGQDNWTSRGHHSPITDGPGQLGARSLHSPVTLDRPGRLDFEARWLLRPLSLVVFPPLFFETLAGSDVILPHSTHFQSGPQKKPTTGTAATGTEVTKPDQRHTREKNSGKAVACLVDSDFTPLCRLVKLCFTLEAG